MKTAYLSLGSNMGDRSRNLAMARAHLKAHIGAEVRESHVYLSKAWGMTEQPDFYNQVVCYLTDKSAEDLLDICLTTERSMGRVRDHKWTRRAIDIDLLFLDDEIRNSQTLTLPHPYISKRNFVLIPLMELAPDLVHPILGKTIEELYLQTEDMLEVLMLENDG